MWSHRLPHKEIVTVVSGPAGHSSAGTEAAVRTACPRLPEPSSSVPVSEKNFSASLVTPAPSHSVPWEGPHSNHMGSSKYESPYRLLHRTRPSKGLWMVWEMGRKLKDRQTDDRQMDKGVRERIEHSNLLLLLSVRTESSQQHQAGHQLSRERNAGTATHLCLRQASPSSHSILATDPRELLSVCLGMVQPPASQPSVYGLCNLLDHCWAPISIYHEVLQSYRRFERELQHRLLVFPCGE